jgi:hypothetical protein
VFPGNEPLRKDGFQVDLLACPAPGAALLSLASKEVVSN